MSGNKRYLLDTNAIIAITADNPIVLSLVDNADFVALSVINVIEFLSFSNLTQKDKDVFKQMTEEATVIDLRLKDQPLIDTTIEIRKSYRLKLPDAVLAATALTYDLAIISNDAELSKVPNIPIITF